MFKRLALTMPAIALASCAQAQAAKLDPKNDIHCSAMVSYAYIASKMMDAPRGVQNAMAFADDYYGKKLQGHAKQRGRDAVMREVEAVVNSITVDPKSMEDELISCFKQANTPGF